MRGDSKYWLLIRPAVPRRWSISVGPEVLLRHLHDGAMHQRASNTPADASPNPRWLCLRGSAPTLASQMSTWQSLLGLQVKWSELETNAEKQNICLHMGLCKQKVSVHCPAPRLGDHLCRDSVHVPVAFGAEAVVAGRLCCCGTLVPFMLG